MREKPVREKLIPCWIHRRSKPEEALLTSSPRWQDLRKKAIEHYHGCAFCGKKTEPLNLHHRFYFKKRAIDEYELHEVAVFCENCHNKLHKAYLNDLKRLA